MSAFLLLLHGQRTRVDDADLDALLPYRWRLSNRGYVVRSHGPVVVCLHRQLLDAPPHRLVDHIDGDKCNNTRANLRLVTPQQSLMNRSLFRNNRVGLKGVTAQHGQYHARIQLNRHLIHLGFYAEPWMAALVYDAAARWLFGPYARLNFDDQSYYAVDEHMAAEDAVERILLAKGVAVPDGVLEAATAPPPCPV